MQIFSAPELNPGTPNYQSVIFPSELSESIQISRKYCDPYRENFKIKGMQKPKIGTFYHKMFHSNSRRKMQHQSNYFLHYISFLKAFIILPKE